MFRKSFQPVVVLVVILMLTACSKSESPSPPVAEAPSGPLKEFSQQIESSTQLQKMKMGETVILPVKVVNTSKEAWPKDGVHLVYFWQDASGNEKIGDCKGTGYPDQKIPSGAHFSTNLSIIAPEKPGKYTLTLTMVQENVAFFNKKGASPLEFSVAVSR